MKNGEGRRALLQFAEKEHSEENVLFFDQAQIFKSKNCFSDHNSEEVQEQMCREAAELIDRFLRPGADMELCVRPNPFKNGLPVDATPAANMFDPVCRVVHKSIEQDIFPRFKQTKLARDLLARLPALAARLSGQRSGSSSGRRGTPLQQSSDPPTLGSPLPARHAPPPAFYIPG